MRERAPAKLNLVLQVGRPRDDGLHPLCSLFARLELADELTIEAAREDCVECPAVDGPNLAERALTAYREESAEGPPPLAVRIDKRIPVAAGLAGGSADAAAVLRAADALAPRPLGPARLRALAAKLGADVPSQVEPQHALVTGVGEGVEPIGLPQLLVLLVPAAGGLSTAAVYAELDRLGAWREQLDSEPVRQLAAGSAEELADGVSNDLQAAALSLRPELAETLAALRDVDALGAGICGSGPTAFGLFADPELAERAARSLPGAILTRTADP